VNCIAYLGRRLKTLLETDAEVYCVCVCHSIIWDEEQDNNVGVGCTISKRRKARERLTGLDKPKISKRREMFTCMLSGNVLSSYWQNGMDC